MRIHASFSRLQNLRNVIEAVLDGSLRTVLTILLLSPIEQDCYEFRRVLTTIQSDETILIEIFVTRTPKQIQLINENYFRRELRLVRGVFRSSLFLRFEVFKSTLVQDMSDGRDSFPRRLSLALLENSRPDDDRIDPDAEMNDGKYLHQNTTKWRMDGSTFIELINKRR